jgi:hypothetical protein
VLHTRIEMLPDPGPRWICQDIRPKYGHIKGSHENVATFFYRSPLVAIQSLFDRPSLLKHMEFMPRRVYQSLDTTTDENNGRGNDGTEGVPKGERIFTEMSTAEWWWQEQVSIYNVGCCTYH